MGDSAEIDQLVARTASRIALLQDPLERAIEYGALIERLQRLVTSVAEDRDGAVIAILTGPRAPSHRQLARQLGISAQRVDQLARLARGGRRA